MSTPAGPAYVGIDLALQEAAAGRRARVAGPLTPWVVRPESAAVLAAAGTIGRAKRPLIVTDRPLAERAWRHLLRLAEAAAIPMVELDGGANVPVGHPLDRTTDRGAALAAADVLVLVEVRDPGLVPDGGGRRSKTVIDISTAPLRNATWVVPDSNGHDPLRLVGDPDATLETLAEALAAAPPAGRRRAPWLPASTVPPVPPLADGAPLDKAGIAQATASAVGGRPSTIVHGSLGGHARAAFRFSHPAEYLGRSGGEGLGYALPASIGAALALRGTGRVAVGFETDGDSLYLPQALWTAAHERIPVLLIVENNRSYWRDEIHQRAVARERGRDETRAAAGVRLRDPDVDFAALARSLGVASTDAVETVGDLRTAVTAGLRVVDEGGPFLIEARTA